MSVRRELDVSAAETACRLISKEISDKSARERMKVLVTDSPALGAAHGLSADLNTLSDRFAEEYRAAAESLLVRKIDDASFFDPKRFTESSLNQWIRSVMSNWRVRISEIAARKCRDSPGEIIEGARPLFATDSMPDSSKDLLLSLASWAEETNSKIRDRRVRTSRSAAAVRLALGFGKPLRPRFDELDLVASATDHLSTTIAFRAGEVDVHPAIPAIFDNYDDAELQRLCEHDTRVIDLIISDSVELYTRPHVRKVDSVIRHFSSLGDSAVLSRAVETFFAFECQPSYDRLDASKRARAAEQAVRLKDEAEHTYTRAAAELGLPSTVSVHDAIGRYSRPIIRELHNEPDTVQEALHV